MCKEGDEKLLKARSTLSNKDQQFAALQKEFEALLSTLRNKQHQFEVLQKEIKDLSAAALPIVDMIAPIDPRTGPPSPLDLLRQAPFVLRPFCETLVKVCVKHVLVLMKLWWPTQDISRLRGINQAIPFESFRELTDEVEGTANQIVRHIWF